MKAKSFQKIAGVVMVIGIVFTFATLLLPELKTDQSQTWNGPAVSYGSSSYTISRYVLPSIEPGEKINVSVSGFTPGSIFFSLFAAPNYDVVPQGSPVLTATASGSRFETVVVSSDSRPYGIFITSQNRTGYVLRVESRWSPYYNLRTYSVVGVFLILIGGVSAAYSALARRKEGTGIRESGTSAAGPARAVITGFEQHEGRKPSCQKGDSQR